METMQTGETMETWGAVAIAVTVTAAIFLSEAREAKEAGTRVDRICHR
jgi:hypothetical protein